MSKLTPLRLARLEKGLSQWDVSRETGIAQTNISLYERELIDPRPEHKKKLSKLYGRKVSEL